MNKQEHIEIHKKIHQGLDELVADFIGITGKLPSCSTIMELIEWSYKQTQEPEDDDLND